MPTQSIAKGTEWYITTKSTKITKVLLYYRKLKPFFVPFVVVAIGELKKKEKG
jgi:hypothetical protein